MLAYTIHRTTAGQLCGKNKSAQDPPRGKNPTTRKLTMAIDTYRSTSFIVVQVHFFSQCFPSFACVDKFPAESEAEADVVAASAPFPNAHIGGDSSSRAVRRSVYVRVVTCARLDRAFSASAGHSMCHSSAGYCIDKSCFSTTCNKRKLI